MTNYNEQKNGVMKMNGSKFSWRAIFSMWQQLLVVAVTGTLLSACGPGLDSLGPFTIGGTATGLTGTVVLQNNGGDNVSLTADGSFTFATKIAKDAAYAVTVLTPPIGQVCTVSSGAGTATEKVTTVAVECITQWKGTKQFGGAGADSFGQSVAVDASGNVYVTGETVGWLDNKPPMGTSDMFLTKFNISGDNPFIKKQGGVLGELTVGTSVATDASGSVYVVGHTTGKLDQDPQRGTTDYFLTKYGSAGNFVYTRQLGVAGKETLGVAVATDSSGNVYVAGYTTGDLVGPTQGGSTGGTDLFVAQYSSSGTPIKTVQFGVAGASTTGTSVTTDASGNVYVAGYTNGDLVGQTPGGSTGGTDLFVVQYDKNLNFVKPMQLGVANADTAGRSVAVDTKGNVYVAGETSGVLPGVNTGFSKVGSINAFVTMFDRDGILKFTVQRDAADPSAIIVGHSVVVDASGSVYLVGETNVTLGSELQTGLTDMFVTHFTMDGNVHYVHQLGVIGKDSIGQSVALDASANVFVAGHMSGGPDGAMGFVTKYDKSGVKQ